MAPPYTQGQTLAWLSADPEGIRVHRAVVQTVEPDADDAHWRIVTDRGAAIVDATGQAGHVLPLDADIERELYIRGDSYLVQATHIDLARDRDLTQDGGLEQDHALDLDDGYGLD